ncbi:DUF6064 family protein [Thioalkalivibrio sp. ALJ1]|uniref:DUF6064 family protein n=1 Tax=Thioalkalivibrio sp. ALJ1 TaxID=1158144 RepID=UPI0005703D93|nr:DUF6064 family protein [Thioalkalivibrio sp. ALJ1]
MLPFDGPTWLAILDQYNQAIWPLHGVAALFVLVSIAMALFSGHFAGRAIGLLMGVLWAWIGLTFFGGSLAPYHFAAHWLAGVFVAQGLMMVFALTVMGRGAFAWPGGWAGLLAVVLMFYAVVAYPLVGLALGDTSWSQLSYVGVAPGPTMLLTLGLLLLGYPRPPLILAIIPCLWALVTAYMAWELGMPLDYISAGLGIVAFVLLVVRRFRREERRLFR